MAFVNNTTEIRKIDLHLHTTVSDGTDSPVELLAKVGTAGVDLFSMTDHDAIKGCKIISDHISEKDPLFLSGVELSCKDARGKYHILGYGYDPSAEPICTLVEKGHAMRVKKLGLRLEILKNKFGYRFSNEDIAALYAKNNPGKPHLASLMVKYGYAKSKDDAFDSCLRKTNIPGANFLPEEAITAILESGGIPVLAHPSYGSGGELITGTDMENRLLHLMDLGIKGVEGYYSTFTPALQTEILALAEKYELYVTAGSDYHGRNKNVRLGDNHLDDICQAPEGLLRFLTDVPLR